VLYVGFLWVDLVKDCICVVLMSRCESYNLEKLRHLLQETYGVRPNTNVCRAFGPILYLYRQNNIKGLGIIIVAMKQSLVNIEQQSFFMHIALLLVEANLVFL